jgi:hypothetical protein
MDKLPAPIDHRITPIDQIPRPCSGVVHQAKPIFPDNREYKLQLQRYEKGRAGDNNIRGFRRQARINTTSTTT